MQETICSFSKGNKGYADPEASAAGLKKQQCNRIQITGQYPSTRTIGGSINF
jgi:hypothetical protein